MTDGAYKRYAPNRGGVVEPTSASVRRQQSAVWHGMEESGMKVLPDGRDDHPPYYEDISPISKDCGCM
jgi:hypothetical protein